jgi:hypothetical protein
MVGVRSTKNLAVNSVDRRTKNKTIVDLTFVWKFNLKDIQL